MTEWIVAVVAALLGAAANHYIPLMHQSLGSRRRRELNGVWLSTSFSTSEHGWITDRIEIRALPMSVRLQNLEMPFGYEYVGKAGFRDNRNLVGHWHSTRDAATSSGPFLLTMNPQGTYLFGFYGGPDADGSFGWNGWCLARTEADLEKARRAMIGGAAKMLPPRDRVDLIMDCDE